MLSVASLLQLGAALLVLLAFVLSQAGRLDPRTPAYLALNAVGAGVLAIDAWHGHEWGFLLLEGVWAAVAVAALVTRPGHRARPVPDAGRPPPR